METKRINSEPTPAKCYRGLWSTNEASERLQQTNIRSPYHSLNPTPRLG